MRVLRLFAPKLIGDLTLCYLHKSAEEETLVNGESLKIKLLHAGETINQSEIKDSLVIVLSKETQIKNRDIISFGKQGAVLKWDDDKSEMIVLTPGFLGVSMKFILQSEFSVAILTVSDKCHEKMRIDTAGPKLEEMVLTLGGCVKDRAIVPDEIDDIKKKIIKWCNIGYNLVFVTGGTGLSHRDVTPEALKEIAEKEVPGFGELMRAKTMIRTEQAFLTRALTIIRKKTLVISLPGSEKGASECFEAISHGLRHSIETLVGVSNECGSKS